MNERRSSKRWHTVLTAQIESPETVLPSTCIVRDLSDTGARLYITETSFLAPEFELDIPSRRVRVRARLVWSRGANHGVMFLERVKAWTDSLRADAA